MNNNEGRLWRWKIKLYFTWTLCNALFFSIVVVDFALNLGTARWLQNMSIEYKYVNDFKLSIKKEIKPPTYKHFSHGSKLGNTLLTQIRVGRSNLHQHKFTIGLSDSPECQCQSRLNTLYFTVLYTHQSVRYYFLWLNTMCPTFQNKIIKRNSTFY